MPRYSVQHPYYSRRDGVTYGPWVEGDEPDLDVEVAEWVNRDSPGTLAGVKPKSAPQQHGPKRGRR